MFRTCFNFYSCCGYYFFSTWQPSLTENSDGSRAEPQQSHRTSVVEAFLTTLLDKKYMLNTLKTQKCTEICG